MARNNRQHKILELIEEKRIETQEELVKELIAAGFEVTQATVSRDIKELGLVKVSASDRKQYYTKERGDNAVALKFADMFRHSVVSIVRALNIIVIKTLSGSANVAGAMLDRINNKSVCGCVAGDDTVLVVVKDEASAIEVEKELKEIAFG